MGLTAIVLGAAAGGGFPQWNCNCDVCRLAWAGDKRVRARTQASLAVSANGARWTLLNASPDLRAQIAAARSKRWCLPAPKSIRPPAC
jgi:pyrroloquinoline quinone biosynthesis protein B